MFPAPRGSYRVLYLRRKQLRCRNTRAATEAPPRALHILCPRYLSANEVTPVQETLAHRDRRRAQAASSSAACPDGSVLPRCVSVSLRGLSHRNNVSRRNRESLKHNLHAVT